MISQIPLANRESTGFLGLDYVTWNRLMVIPLVLMIVALHIAWVRLEAGSSGLPREVVATGETDASDNASGAISRPAA